MEWLCHGWVIAQSCWPRSLVGEVGRVLELSRFIRTCSHSARESALCAIARTRSRRKMAQFGWYSAWYVLEQGHHVARSAGGTAGGDAMDGTDSSSESTEAQPSKPNSAKTRARQLKQAPARARRRLHTGARRAQFWSLGYSRPLDSTRRFAPCPQSCTFAASSAAQAKVCARLFSTSSRSSTRQERDSSRDVGGPQKLGEG